VPSATESPICGNATSTTSPPACEPSPGPGAALAGGPLGLDGVGIGLDRLRGTRLGRRRAGPVAADLDLPQHRADLDGVVRPGVDRGEHSGGGRGDLGVDLVGRDLDDRLLGLDAVADPLAPFEDGPLGHRVAHLGHRDLDRGALRHEARTLYTPVLTPPARPGMPVRWPFRSLRRVS
jgi:hypothetical protein